jgi:hypothetical protein
MFSSMRDAGRLTGSLREGFLVRLTESPDFFRANGVTLYSTSPGAVGFGVGHRAVAFVERGTHLQLFFGMLKSLSMTAEEVRLPEPMYSNILGRELRDFDMRRLIISGDRPMLRLAIMAWASRNNLAMVGISYGQDMTGPDPNEPQRDFWLSAGRAWSTPRGVVVSVWREDVVRATSTEAFRGYSEVASLAYGPTSSPARLEVYGHPISFALSNGMPRVDS